MTSSVLIPGFLHPSCGSLVADSHKIAHELRLRLKSGVRSAPAREKVHTNTEASGNERLAISRLKQNVRSSNSETGVVKPCVQCGWPEINAYYYVQPRRICRIITYLFYPDIHKIGQVPKSYGC